MTSSAGPEPRADDMAAAMAGAAAAWLDSLDGDQRVAAAWRWPSDDERHLWFYTPTDHGGLAMGDMRPGQQRRAMQLLASGLSRAGYVTVSTIMGLDNVLDELEGWTMQWGRERGRDPGHYYLRVFGEPRDGGTWSWRFGGHHVSINHTVVDGAVAAVTPCFLGADPASSPLLGPHPLRPLGGAEDLGRELVRSLDPGQLARAVLSPVAPVDIAGANRSRLADGDGPLPLGDVWRGRFDGELGAHVDAIQQRAEETAGLRIEHLDALRLTAGGRGVAASAMSATQKGGLRALLDVYLRRVPDALADQEASKYHGDAVDRLWFAWAGAVEPGEPHYYRVQGPGLLVEYDNTQRGANHVHTVWRDPERDFGRDALAAHRLAHH